MGIFGNALKAIQDKAGSNNYYARFTGKNFAEAVAAIAALVASADGEVEAKEVAKMERFLAVSPALQHFDKAEIKGMFNRFVAMVEFTPQKVYKELNDVKGDERQDIWDVGFAIAASDGEIEPAEEKVLRKIADAWSLDVSDRFS